MQFWVKATTLPPKSNPTVSNIPLLMRGLGFKERGLKELNLNQS
jgi:hypothetical protein